MPLLWKTAFDSYVNYIFSQCHWHFHRYFTERNKETISFKKDNTPDWAVMDSVLRLTRTPVTRIYVWWSLMELNGSLRAVKAITYNRQWTGMIKKPYFSDWIFSCIWKYLLNTINKLILSKGWGGECCIDREEEGRSFHLENTKNVHLSNYRIHST